MEGISSLVKWPTGVGWGRKSAAIKEIYTFSETTNGIVPPGIKFMCVLLFKKKKNYYLMWLFWVLAVACELSCSRHVGSDYCVRDWTWAPCETLSAESHPLDHQGSTFFCFLLLYLYLLCRKQKHSRIYFSCIAIWT